MFLVLALFLYIHHRTTDLRKAAAALLLLAVLLVPLLFVVFQIVDTYRVRPGYVDPSVGDLLDTARSMDYGASGKDSTRFVRRLALGSMLSTAVGAVDSGLIDSQNGRTLWPAFVWFVPRAFWRDKPTLSTGGWFAHDALGWAPDAGEAAITLPGDLYINFGISAVLVGMFLYGSMLRLAHLYLVGRRDPGAGLWVHIPIFLCMVLGFERNFAAIFGRTCQYLLMTLVAIWIIERFSDARLLRRPGSSWART